MCVSEVREDGKYAIYNHLFNDMPIFVNFVYCTYTGIARINVIHKEYANGHTSDSYNDTCC